MAAAAPRLALPFGAAAAMHAAVAAAIVILSTQPPVSLPPIYRVDIVGAPPGPRPAAGVVPTTPAPPTPQTKAPPEPAHTTPPKEATVPVPKARPKPPPPKATPSTATTKAAPAPQQTAASVAGGKGADVATVHTEGAPFPYPAYLENIVRQVAQNFRPDNPDANLRAAVAFVIRRDGSVIGIRLTQRSSDYGFDLEAQGAIEKAATSFGPLPQAYPDDALSIVFNFDPKLLR